MAQEAPLSADDLYQDRQVWNKSELFAVLKAMREEFLKNPTVKDSVRTLRGDVGRGPFLFALATLALGLAGQVAGYRLHWAFLPVALVLQLMGLAAFNSLAHESWHRQAYPGRETSDRLGRWLIAPLLLRNHDRPAYDHILHHKMPGEEQDPSSGVWAQSQRELVRSLLTRLLIVPAAFEVLRGIVTGRRPGTNWSDTSHKLSKAEIARIAMLHLPWLGLMLWASPWAVLTGWALPMSLGSAAAHLREYREHSRREDGTTAVYDSLCTPAERLLISGGAFHLHALHHIFPEVPQEHLPRFHRMLSGAIDMETAYYGHTPQVGKRRSYLVS